MLNLASVQSLQSIDAFPWKVLPAFSSRGDKRPPKQSLYFSVRAAVALDWSCWFIYQSLTTL